MDRLFGLGPLMQDDLAGRPLVPSAEAPMPPIEPRVCPHCQGRLIFIRPLTPQQAMALTGRLRHCAHRSVPEIHQALREWGVAIAERSVTNLLDRYDELLATS